ncbi:type II toxin-antitoxin system VapC family toxin [Pararhizobium antarcticum]|uniref:type II toxin-antitoxin system VapC family toxin n=1 Tax=Pararhizobium antarcticum TaxID=1798805 RepID=UPI001FD9BC4E|nr:type II toxin-antitoxin system VapC family toxin [Pararhizobium antarcticum]
MNEVLSNNSPDLYVSVATLWEMAIKWRLGKLEFGMALEDLTAAARSGDIQILAITEHHALHHVEPEPPTRDPFDRLLLAQCAIEDMRLVTIDRALANHPLSATSS